MVLLDHVVQVLDLADLDGCLALGIYRVQRGPIGAALVDSHCFGRAVLTDSFVKEAPRCRLVPLGSEQEINGVTGLVHRPVKILPLALSSLLVGQSESRGTCPLH